MCSVRVPIGGRTRFADCIVGRGQLGQACQTKQQCIHKQGEEPSRLRIRALDMATFTHQTRLRVLIKVEREFPLDSV